MTQLQVVTGTLSAIAANPLFADYIGDDQPGAGVMGVLADLSVIATLSPMSSQLVAESWAQVTQYPLNDSNGPDYLPQHPSGYINVCMLNPNGVPSSYEVEFWLVDFSSDVDVHWRGTLYATATGYSSTPAAGQPAMAQDQLDRCLTLALTQLPSCAVVVA